MGKIIGFDLIRSGQHNGILVLDLDNQQSVIIGPLDYEDIDLVELCRSSFFDAGAVSKDEINTNTISELEVKVAEKVILVYDEAFRANRIRRLFERNRGVLRTEVISTQDCENRVIRSMQRFEGGDSTFEGVLEEMFKK